MEENNLLVVSLAAFLAVLFLLSLLSGLIRLLTVVFPGEDSGRDEAAERAVRLAVQELLPGSKVTRIEEMK